MDQPCQIRESLYCASNIALKIFHIYCFVICFMLVFLLPNPSIDLQNISTEWKAIELHGWTECQKKLD